MRPHEEPRAAGQWCGPCTRKGCPARAYPGAQRLPSFRQMERWRMQHLRREGLLPSASWAQRFLVSAGFGVAVGLLGVGTVFLGVWLW